ncbi:hypothetical protein LPJ61_001609 [Coemansia biformis]|uniref:PIN domain-containing protein n=1 Tax=Coemansia biformis TaxID=1286918 RepID=A0A9W7Y9P8_9FUNG|nr:hypothetical protein LPJ61_001609 [Coemansia biformis]
MAAVVDTNYLIDHLPLVRTLAETALAHGLVVVVPWIVIQELDGLKSSRKVTHVPGLYSVELGTQARTATRFLDSELGRSGSALRCQRRSEYIVDEFDNDNKILDCCLYFSEKKGLPVAILTKDRNLAVKARANGCATCGVWAGSAAELISAVAAAVGRPAQGTARASSSSSSQYTAPNSAPILGGSDRSHPLLKQQQHTAGAADGDGMDIDEPEGPDFEQNPDNHTGTVSAAVVAPVTPTSPVYGAPAATAPAGALALPAYGDALQGTPSSDEPVLIYLDEIPASVAAWEAEIGGVPAHVVSREITQYMCDSRQCPLTNLIVARLEKSAVVSYSNAFASPPWKSCTTLLTVILYYWNVFSCVFPKGVSESIRAMLPWVMHVEHLTHCPQTLCPLPSRLSAEPYKYAVESDNVFDNTRNQAAERIAETAKLIRLAKRLLAQCALIETEAQESERLWAVQCWMIWQKANS